MYICSQKERHVKMCIMYTSFGKVDELSTTRHLKFGYISILTNLLRTGNETKSVKTIYN